MRISWTHLFRSTFPHLPCHKQFLVAHANHHSLTSDERMYMHRRRLLDVRIAFQGMKYNMRISKHLFENLSVLVHCSFPIG